MKFTILGGGIAGLTAAIALQQKGLEVEIFEAATHIKPVGAGLGLGANAIKVFEKLSIANDIIAAGRKLEGFSFCSHKGSVLNHTGSEAVTQKFGIDNFTIHRATLHQQLLRHAGNTPIYLNKKVTSFTQSNNNITLTFSDGSTHNAQYLIVADGIHSAVRQQLLPHIQPRYAGYVCWRAVVDARSFCPGEASETFGPKGRFGIVPLQGDQVYWFACINAPRKESLAHYTITDLRKNFKGYHPLIGKLLEQTKNEQLIYDAIADLPPLEKFAFNNIVLIGDAAHATTPNMGQGACQAIESAYILADELSKNPVPEEAFKNYENKRLPRTRYITLQSRRIGQVAQWQNPLLGGIRSILFRLMPESTRMKQLDKIYTVDF